MRSACELEQVQGTHPLDFLDGHWGRPTVFMQMELDLKPVTSQSHSFRGWLNAFMITHWSVEAHTRKGILNDIQDLLRIFHH